MERWIESDDRRPSFAPPSRTELPAPRLVTFPQDRTVPRGGQRPTSRLDTAIDQLRKQGPVLVAANRGDDLLAWTDSFPPALRAREPWLLHFHAAGLRLTSDAYAGAARMQEQARETFLATNQSDGAARALAELGLLAVLRGSPDDALRLLTHAERESPLLDPFLAGFVRSTLTKLAAYPAADDALFGRNDAIRARLASALATERITPHGLSVLRDQYRLTPAETSVFVAYYLGDGGIETGASSMRRELALALNLSENTLMHHVTSIRRKLGLEARKGSATVLMWCLQIGITKLRTAAPAL